MSRTLHITIESDADNSDLEEDLAAIDAGDDVDPDDPTLSFESLEAFGRVFRPTNLELLQAIVQTDPASIRELARIVDRHPSEVADNVHELTACGLVDLESDGSAKRPTIWYDDIDVAIPIRDATTDPTPV